MPRSRRPASQQPAAEWGGANPFASLSGEGLPAGPAQPVAPSKLGRVEVRREKKGRGGKEVTTLTAFARAPGNPDEFLRELKSICGAGGARLPGGFFVQGDQRARVREFLENRGYRPIMAGG